MTIPTKLITTTIEEFSAEGYTCKSAKVDGDAIATPTSATQIVTLVFYKTEEEE